MFESDKNADVKRSDRTTVDSNYDSNNIWKTMYLAISHAYVIASKVDCHLSCISYLLWFTKIQPCKLDQRE